MKNTLQQYFIIGLFLLSFAQIANTQDATTKMSYVEFWKAILTCTQEKYVLRNASIQVNEGDQEIVDALFKDNPKVTCRVNFENIQFDMKVPNFYGDNLLIMAVKNTYFEKRVTFSNIKGLAMIEMETCAFGDGLEIYGIGDLDDFVMNNCNLQNRFILNIHNNKDKRVVIQNTQIHTKMYEPKGIIKERHPSSTVMTLDDKTQYWFYKSTFTTDSMVNWIGINGGINGLRIDSCDFQLNLVLDQNHIKERLEVKNSIFQSISWHETTFPVLGNISFRWNQLKGPLALMPLKQKEYKDDNNPNITISSIYTDYFTGLKKEDLKDEFLYDELMAIYNTWFKIYRERADLESANACYIDMKNVQTARLQYLYERSGTTNAWFNWKLNVFLKIFADYGTNPVKAIIFSIWTILGFAFLYFFFYSSWDKINRAFLVEQHQKLLKYFSSRQSLKEIYSKENAQEFKAFQEYKRTLKRTKSKVPFFIYVFGKPLYWLSVMRFRTMRSIFNRTEIMHSSWEELPSNKRLWIGIKAVLGLFCYIVFLIFSRALNSIMLSINTFSTLGFGDIPVTGASRYLAIIEGFVGWFLLSIFSVSLISQILQN